LSQGFDALQIVDTEVFAVALMCELHTEDDDLRKQSKSEQYEQEVETPLSKPNQTATSILFSFF
jgi:hypothetical protein